MVGAVKKLLESRKFLVMILGMLAAIGARLGLPEEAAEQCALTICVLAGTYVGAMGMADWGATAQAATQEAPDVDTVD